ncbi:MAG: beta-lactamase family protein [Acidimicrobiia bacterium]|nr:beta-lactamase family protein [Acidimicrobiia bacterium]
MIRPLRVTLVCCVLAAAGCSGSGSDSTAESTTTASETAPPTAEIVASRGDMPEDVADELESAVVDVMNEAGIPGAFVGVSVPGLGRWETVAGTADLDTGEPVEFGFHWPVRSLTKSMVVTRLLQLVDEGTVNLDDTVDQYVEGVPNGDTITLRQLADMSAGLANYTATDAFLESFTSDPDQLYTIEDLNEFAFTGEPEFPPGSEHSYSNTNTNVLGQVIETAGDAPLGDQLATDVFEPLGMGDTEYLPDALAEPAATGYQPGPDGYEEPPNNFSGMGPSGAVVSTSDDLFIWAEALGTGALISDALQNERLAAEPLAEGPVYDAYGLGIGTRLGYWGHTGQGLGFTALAMRDPDTDATVVVLANASETEPQPMDGLFAAVAEVLDAP